MKEGDAIAFLTNTSELTQGLPTFLAEPMGFLALITKFLLAGIGIYLLYLIILLITNLKRGRRMKRIEQKLDLIIEKLNIKTEKDTKTKKEDLTKEKEESENKKEESKNKKKTKDKKKN